jgi:hypothetical protein
LADGVSSWFCYVCFGILSISQVINFRAGIYIINIFKKGDYFMLALTGAVATIESEDLATLLDTVTANIGVILPVGVGLFAIVLGIKFVPRILAMFSRG